MKGAWTAPSVPARWLCLLSWVWRVFPEADWRLNCLMNKCFWKVCQSEFISKEGSCMWNAHAARLQGALLALSASWENSLWPESICKSRPAPQLKSLGWSVPVLSLHSSAHRRQMVHSWTEPTCSPPGQDRIGLGQTALDSGRLLQSRGCPGCCTLHSSLWGSGSPVKWGKKSISQVDTGF